MRIGVTTKVFFDASTILAALRSPQGGSGHLMAIAAEGWYVGLVSPGVLIEVTRNALLKMGPLAVARLDALLGRNVLRHVVPTPEHNLGAWAAVVNEKDRHVVAACLAGHAHYLISLDKGLVAEVGMAGLSVQAVSPAVFISEVLPHHPRSRIQRPPAE